VSERELHESAVYRDYLRPLGIEYSMVVALPTLKIRLVSRWRARVAALALGALK
jgi:hypothetical protein